MIHHTRNAMALSLIAAFVITGCRFNPQAARKVAESSRATAQAANTAPGTEAKANTAVTIVATRIPVQAVATSAPATSASVAEPAAVVAAQPEAPASAAPVAQSNQSLLPAVSNAAAPAAGAPVAVPAVDVPAAAPSSVSVTTPKKSVRPIVRTQPKVVSQRPKRTQARVVRRSLARVGCVVASNISVNRRKSSSLSAGILGRVAPRTRFVALARSKTGRWLFGVSRGRTGWVAASTLSCGADTRRLTVRAR